MSTDRNGYDVLVVGAGPSGSTAAALLARAGHRVAIIEKDSFPRFRIGESLLPIDLPVFERLGFVPDRTRYVYKVGAEFLDEKTGDFALYRFCDGLDGTPPHAWQVDRALFDQALLSLALQAGVEHHRGRVREVDIGETSVRVTADLDNTSTSFSARYLVDASGPQALMGRLQRGIVPLPGFGVAASYCHLDDVSASVDDELKEMGNIKVLMRPHGWCWVIPLPGRRCSLGIVTTQKGLTKDSINDAIGESPILSRIATGAVRSTPSLVGNFSYYNHRAYGPRYAAVGDAAGFLDPVFSSGVSLGLVSAEWMADRLADALASGQEDAPELMAPLRDRMRHGYTCFGSLVKSFYHTNLVKHLFFCPDPDLKARAGLITMLAGDVWREDNEFQNALLAGRRHWSIPDPI